MQIEKTLKSINEKIHIAAANAGRNPESIQLVAVSKTIELESIIEAVKAGAQILGENKVQEARDKISNYKSQASNLNVEWHLIGNLQKNKSKYAVGLFNLIHSVDDLALAQELDRQAKKINKIQRVLIQVKLSNETTKHGVREKDLIDLIEKVSNMNNLKLDGLMTMPPFFEDAEKTRPYFRKLRETGDMATQKGYPINELSMGMSNDFEVAIEEGSTMVRVGTAIFGERTYKTL